MRLFLFLFSAFYLALLVSAGRDFYKILGLDRNADKSEIKRAFKILSKKYHPDKNSGSSDKFVELTDAYEVLSDDEKREIYDRHGEEGLKNGGGHSHQDPFDIFNMFFGRGRQQQERKGPDLVIRLEVTLEDLYNGRKIEVDVNKQVLCDHCNGSGADKKDDFTTCSACGGNGIKVVRQQFGPGMFQTIQTTCDKCEGKGKIIKSVCHVCKGRKVLRGNEQLTIEIDPGMHDDEKLVFENEGDENPDWVPGDIIFQLHTQPHPIFTRRDDNLYMKQTITLIDALAGFKKTFRHLDGRIVELRRDTVTQPGFVQTIENEGMPVLHGNIPMGKLFVEYQVVLPTEVEEGVLDALRKGTHFRDHVEL